MMYLQAGVEERAAWSVLAASRLPLHPGKLLDALGSLVPILGPSRLDVVHQLGWRPSWIRRLLELDPAKELQRSESALQKGFEPLLFSDPSYPSLLRQLATPPPILWIRGNRAALNLPGVALVGSRSANAYGLEVSVRLAGDLAAAGVCLISGGALGCDAAAHRAALERGGSSIAVLGTGIDLDYPSEHQRLFSQLCETGACVSEFVPGTPPRANHFPIRNRLISGLSLGVVVVQGLRKSGALITARFALEQDREIFAVPGLITDPQSEGPHHLLRQGAALATSAADVLEVLAPKLPASVHWPERSGRTGASAQLSFPALKPLAEAAAATSPSAAKGEPMLPALEPEARLVWEGLTRGPANLDVLAHRTGLSTERLGAVLFELELDALVIQSPGQIYGLNSGGRPG